MNVRKKKNNDRHTLAVHEPMKVFKFNYKALFSGVVRSFVINIANSIHMYRGEACKEMIPGATGQLNYQSPRLHRVGLPSNNSSGRHDKKMVIVDSSVQHKWQLITE